MTELTRLVFISILLVVGTLIAFVACAPDLGDRGSDGTMLPVGIKKFTDGNVSCWVYKDKGISCVKIK